MFKRISDIVKRLNFVSTEGVPLRRLMIGTSVAAAILIILAVVNRGSAFFVTQRYVDELAIAFGLSKHLANAIFWLSFAAFSYFAGLVFSVDPKNRRNGITGVTALLVTHSLALWYATKDQPFARGMPAKCYVVTRDAIQYGDATGIDPTTGLDCKPVTPEVVEKIEKYKRGIRPARIIGSNPTFFDPRTGNPIIWYSVSPNDKIEIFDLMGFNPETGAVLLPITPEAAANWKVQQALASREPPARVFPGIEGPWFDPRDGRSLLWFRPTQDGGYEFFDKEGFDPQSGAPLERVTATNLEAVRKYLADSTAKRCYVLTPKAVRYRPISGLDPETGRECRPVTADLLVRLKEYEKGKRPSLIDTKLPTMFDPRSGEPIVWFWKSSDGRIELFDLMGFHPRTGDELLPINRAVAEEFDAQSRAPKTPPRAPEKIDPSAATCFDALTGEPRCWFWKDGTGALEFYDATGFHPKFGDPLVQVTREVIQKLEEDARFQAKQLQDEQLARAREKEAQRAQAEKEEREREARRLAVTKLAEKCDDLAANPNDRNRVGRGVPIAVLKQHGQQAIAACEEAVRQSPDELRLRYQLARAFQTVNRTRAYGLFEWLVSKGYPAAHDNFGWMLYDDRKSIQRAVEVFRRGVHLGDPDSMVSLAEMISRDAAEPRNGAETKISLYAQACELGHERACQAASEENDREARRDRQIEEQKAAIELFKGLLRGLPVGIR